MTNHQKQQTSALGGVIDEAEAFVAATAEMGEDKLVNIRKGLESDLEVARAHLAQLESGLKDKAIDVDDYVHANPWQAIGVAAGAGVVAGVLVGAVAFRR
jgi:ElaB/YqjD/DUF883 family membrane-anchored ribosome-binding protein